MQAAWKSRTIGHSADEYVQINSGPGVFRLIQHRLIKGDKHGT